MHLHFSGKWGPYAGCLNGTCVLADCHASELNTCHQTCEPKDRIPGRRFLSEHYSRPLGTRCKRTSSFFADCQRPWELWPYLLAQLLPAASMVNVPSGGRCKASEHDTLLPHASSNCSWHLITSGKRIGADCVKARLVSAVQAHNPLCFSGCSSAGLALPGHPCYIRCVYDTLFGNGTATEPMQQENLMQVWRAAFENPSRGGCPGVEP